MSENKYRIVRQSVTVEPVKPTLKERVIDIATTVLAIILGITVALILALILNSCDH